MRLDKPLIAITTGGLLLALASGCASPAKQIKSQTDILDGAGAQAAAPLPSKPEPVAATTPAPEPQAASCDISRVHFAFDSALLDDSARQELRAAAACLQQRKSSEVVIEGHCDERGTTAYNLALGAKRAAAVKGYLSDLGVKAEMQTISFGKELPLVKGTGEQVWSQNRRAELKQKGEMRTDGVIVSLR